MSRLRVRSVVLSGLALTAAGTAGCINPLTALPKLFEARRLASELHVSFTRAADASNRAVMADTDEASIAAKDDATAARQAVDHDLVNLQPILTELDYADELRALAAFKTRYEEYRRLDDEILPLAIENSNLKAQRLSFGDAQEAAKAFRAALDAAAHLASPSQSSAAALLANRAEIGVLEIQVLQAPHIAESNDAAMTRMEGAMHDSAVSGKAARDPPKATLP